MKEIIKLQHTAIMMRFCKLVKHYEIPVEQAARELECSNTVVQKWLDSDIIPESALTLDKIKLFIYKHSRPVISYDEDNEQYLIWLDGATRSTYLNDDFLTIAQVVKNIHPYKISQNIQALHTYNEGDWEVALFDYFNLLCAS